jgi:aromatic ring-cleaving dioxygenase
MSQVADIRGFHAHVYFDTTTRSTAERVHDALGRHLGVKLGALHDRAEGPHAKPMFQVTVAPELFATVVPWLMVNRDGLSVLVHPTTDDSIADHETSPLWMGEPLAIDIELLRRHVRRHHQPSPTVSDARLHTRLASS